MKKSFLIVLSFIMIIIIIAICYHFPNKIYREITVCSIEGEQATAYLDIKWHRYFFKPTEVRGSIKVNETEYVSILDTNITYNYRLLFDAIKEDFILKVTNQRYPYLFVRDDPTSYLIENQVMFHISDEKLNKISLWAIEDGNLTVYYGPASTGEEALLMAADTALKGKLY